MAKVDLKLVMAFLALALLVMLLDNADADASSRRRSFSSDSRRRSFSSGRRRRSFSSGRRRRSSYGSSRSRSSSGLVTGLVIFFAFVVLITIGSIIACCYCRSRRLRNNGSIVTPQPPIQYRTEYQTGSESAPPPYDPSGASYGNPMMDQSAYPPSVEKNSQMYPPPPGAPPMPYPTTDGASPLPYPSDAYPPTQVYVPPQEVQGAAVAPYPSQVPPGVEASAPPIPPPSYDDVVKENQGGRRSDETPR